MSNRTKLNKKAKRKLKELYLEKGHNGYCELRLPGCKGKGFTGFAHRHPRRWYYDKPDELLWSYSQTIIACVSCHRKIDRKQELREKKFKELRDKEQPGE